MELAEEGDLPAAIENEKKAYTLASQEEVVRKTLSVLYNSYGLELKDQGNVHKSLQSLKSALEYEPDQPQIKKNMAVIYLELAYQAFGKNEYINCRRFLKNAEDFDENNPYIYVLFGEVAYALDNYYQAESDWTQALKLDPNLYDVAMKLQKLKQDKELEGNFKVKEVENFRMKFEGIDNQDVAETAGQVLKDAYRSVGQDFNLYPRVVVPVIIYPADKLKKLDYFPDWAAGTYDGKIRIGDNLGKSDLLLKDILYHEYTHVLVYILAQGNAPLWLNEGLAEYEANRFKKAMHRKARKKMLYKAIEKDTLFSLDQLGEMNLSKLGHMSAHRIELVYAQSESFVTYLIKRTSLYDMRKLLEHLGGGDSIHKAVKDVLYVDLETLERDWKREVDKD